MPILIARSVREFWTCSLAAFMLRLVPAVVETEQVIGRLKVTQNTH